MKSGYDTVVIVFLLFCTRCMDFKSVASIFYDIKPNALCLRIQQKWRSYRLERYYTAFSHRRRSDDSGRHASRALD